MHTVSLEQLKSDGMNAQGSWHFHILSPTCGLNDTEQFAMVLEREGEEPEVFHSDEPPKEVGKELAEHLHKLKVDETDVRIGELNESDANVVRRARELSDAETAWHHHMLYPDCMFNPNKPDWAFVIEAGDEWVQTTSANEPREVLKAVEPLFWMQKQIG